jgi:hypothetical protein
MSLERIDEIINKIPNAPTKLRNFIYTAGILTNKYNEYGIDLYTAINLIFKNNYDLVKEIIKKKKTYEYICTFIVEECTNILIGTMTMNDNTIGTITIFPEFRNKRITTSILTNIFNVANKSNFPINIYPNSELESIVKKIGFLYFPAKDKSYAYNKYGDKSQVIRYVSKKYYNKKMLVVDKKDYKELFDVLGYNSQSTLNLLCCCDLIDLSGDDMKCKLVKLLELLSSDD